jgi:hypothetical protein
MTPAEEEARFIALWDAGIETAAIARQLGLKATTAQARAWRLQQRGLIQPRPRGGNYPSQRAQGRQEGAPAPPAVTFVAVPDMQELLSLVKDLHARVGALEQTRALPAPPTTPAPPAADRKDIQQWTVRLSKALIEHLKAVAYERRMPPSQLVEELVWTALNNQSPSTPEPASTPDRKASWKR